MNERFCELLTDSTAADFHTVLFDSNPLPTFVLDADSCVLDFNAAASEFLGTAPSEGFHHRLGDLFQCRNAVETIDRCGTTPDCSRCGVRCAIAGALNGRSISRSLHPMELIRNDELVHVDFLVTTAPTQDGNNRLALLILEDVTELMDLRQQEHPGALVKLQLPTKNR